MVKKQLFTLSLIIFLLIALNTNVFAQKSETTPSIRANFVVTAVRDNLNNNDMYLMASGLRRLGYSEWDRDTNVSTNNLRYYLSSYITTLYHTGHGGVGSVSTSTGTYYRGGTTINASNTIFATCLTLSDRNWRYDMGSSANTISGYTKFSFDYTDDTVVNTFTRQLGYGRSYPVSWYLANVNIGSLSDRWCIYARNGGYIYEYSARSGNIPRSSVSAFTSLDPSERLLAASDILERKDMDRVTFAHHILGKTDQGNDFDDKGFGILLPTDLNENEAIQYATSHLKNSGEWTKGITFDRASNIEIRSSDDDDFETAGWMIRFSKTMPDNMKICGNKVDVHKTLLVGENGKIIAFTKNWPTISSTQNYERSLSLLSVSDALTSAKEEILGSIKQGSMKIVSANPVYGFSQTQNELIPAYGYQTEDNITIVVDAQTGKLVN